MAKEQRKQPTRPTPQKQKVVIRESNMPGNRNPPPPPPKKS